jgi:ArsR family transcriptional regulator
MTETPATQEKSTTELRDLSRYFYALKEVWRLRMLLALADADELSVSEIAELLGLSQPLVSWHLRRLRQASVVNVRREGRESFYSLDRERIATYRASFERLLGM